MPQQQRMVANILARRAARQGGGAPAPQGGGLQGQQALADQLREPSY
jgi:hypothetical protein